MKYFVVLKSEGLYLELARPKPIQSPVWLRKTASRKKLPEYQVKRDSLPESNIERSGATLCQLPHQSLLVWVESERDGKHNQSVETLTTEFPLECLGLLVPCSGSL